jgi:hypothetical protein
MRRCLSSWLLLLTLMTSVSPLLALMPQTVPACCRADGKHHCGATLKLSGEGFRAQATACPFRSMSPALRTHAALHSGRLALAMAAARAELTLSHISDPVVRSSYTLPERGPPLA